MNSFLDAGQVLGLLSALDNDPDSPGLGQHFPWENDTGTPWPGPF